MTSSVPVWEIGGTISNPSTNQPLVTHMIPMGTIGLIHGFWISTTDPNGNVFVISWKHNGVNYQQLMIADGATTIKDVAEQPFNQNYPADVQSAITIYPMNASAGNYIYQASLFIKEQYVGR